MWSPYCYLTDYGAAAGYSITKLKFDPYYELLWSGSCDGKLTSFAFPECAVYSSRYLPGGPIVDILPHYEGVIAVSEFQAVMYSRGGVCQQKFAEQGEISCATLSSDTFGAVPRVIFGGPSSQLHAFNLDRPNRPCSTMNIRCPGVQVISCSNEYLIAGGSDGTVDIVDAHMRSLKPLHSFAAFSGSIIDMAFDSHIVSICGMHGQSINPYDPKAPCKYYPDPNFKQFDLRMMKVISSLCFPTNVPPKFLHMITAQEFDGREENIVDRLLVGTQTGECMHYERPRRSNLSFYPIPDTYCMIGNGHTSVTSIAASKSGSFLAVGDTDGTVSLLTSEGASNTVNGGQSYDISWPNLKPDFHLRDSRQREVSASCSSFIKHKQHRGSLFSDFPQKLALQPLKCAPTRTIKENILSDARWDGYLGCIDNPGMPRNSYIFTKHPGLYSTMDPRKHNVGYSPTRRRSSESSMNEGTPSSLSMKYEFRSLLGVENSTTPISSRYRRPIVRLTKRGKLDFKFIKYNKTELPGLENNTSESSFNAVLQILYYIPELRSSVIGHQCDLAICLTCELSFLFHMMDMCRSSLSSRIINCHAGNFVIALRQNPSAIALGLFENDEKSLDQRVRNFYRFIVNSVASHAQGASKVHEGHALDIFRFKCMQTNVCQLGHQKQRICSVQFVEMGQSNLEQHFIAGAHSFSEILLNSLKHNTNTRAWCDACNEYLRMKQSQAVATFPSVLNIFWSCEMIHASKIWRANNLVGGSWIPLRIRMAVRTDGSLQIGELVESANSTTEPPSWKYTTPIGDNLCWDEMAIHTKEYKLCSLLSSINESENLAIDSRSSTHLVSHVEVGKSYRKPNSEKNASWVLFNDFRVTETFEHDAVDCIPEWKVPILLLFRDIDNPGENAVPVALHKTYIDHDFDTASDVNPFMDCSKPKRGDLIGIDTEFVLVEMEQYEILANGSRIVTREGRQSLARVSLVDRNMQQAIVDDYVIVTEPVLDFMTRFSGITQDDLDPSTSHHNLVNLKEIYVKLRCLVDRGCIFVGHGLKTDFCIINLVVPDDQVLDTVELFRLENRRMISLRFLTAYLLQEDIQAETHDSIEDAIASMRLYLKYEELVKAGIFEETLLSIYDIGAKCKWKISDIHKFRQSG